MNFKMYHDLASYVRPYKAMVPYCTLLDYYMSMGMLASF
uniref:Uncharacterized protein n=1 Tax=Picea glauca TaxID=3330 RepID=A0A101M1Z9_PICGL|nr:hypothetical protein ABT39_MTgene3987 [Picea glauca]QHR86969.1 hypothetical protein Q903MT_gene978 [Picea sitchensis]